MTLLDLRDRYRGAFEYDWHTRFGKSSSEIGITMSWSDAWHLIGVLVSDPASYLGAALAGWSYPVDRQTLVDMDTYDLMHKIAHAQGGGKGRKPKPYPRPWPSSTKAKTKPSADLTQEEIVAALRRAGHTAALPGVLRPRAQPRDARGRFVKVG